MEPGCKDLQSRLKVKNINNNGKGRVWNGRHDEGWLGKMYWLGWGRLCKSCHLDE